MGRRKKRGEGDRENVNGEKYREFTRKRDERRERVKEKDRRKKRQLMRKRKN